MAEVTYLNIPVGLLGRWRAEWDSDDGRSEYQVAVRAGRLIVTGKDCGDGEEYVISNIAFDCTTLTFETFMASTGRKGRISLRTTATAEVQMTFTFTDVCRAVRIPEVR